MTSGSDEASSVLPAIVTTGTPAIAARDTAEAIGPFMSPAATAAVQAAVSAAAAVNATPQAAPNVMGPRVAHVKAAAACTVAVTTEQIAKRPSGEQMSRSGPKLVITLHGELCAQVDDRSTVGYRTKD